MMQEDVIPLARELGIGIVPWGPMGAGFLTGSFTSRADFKEGDIRGHRHSKMSEANFDKVTPSGAFLTRCQANNMPHFDALVLSSKH